MKAKKLIVTAAEYSSGNIEETSYEFPVYEFQNGLILVVSQDTNDLFYEDRESIKANGYAQVTEIVETETVSGWDLFDLQRAIRASLAEFGSVPAKALAMLG